MTIFKGPNSSIHRQLNRKQVQGQFDHFGALHANAFTLAADFLMFECNLLPTLPPASSLPLSTANLDHLFCVG